MGFCEDARLIMPFRRAQALFGQRGKINSILISNAGDAAAGAEHSVVVTSHLRGLLTDYRVAVRIVDLLSSDSSAARALRAEAAGRRGESPTFGRRSARGSRPSGFRLQGVESCAAPCKNFVNPFTRELFCQRTCDARGLGYVLRILCDEQVWNVPTLLLYQIDESPAVEELNADVDGLRFWSREGVGRRVAPQRRNAIVA